MIATLLDGKALAEKIKHTIARRIKKTRITPGLGIVLVGNNPASEIYVGIKQREAEALGFKVVIKKLPVTTSQKILNETVMRLDARDDINGIIVQVPLPAHLDAANAVAAMMPWKDVDGFHPWNFGLLALGYDARIAATPAGILKLLDAYRVPIAGKHAVVVGRSAIVGKPIAQLLLQRDATVTMCHSKTKRLADYTRTADILIVSVGKPKLIKGSMIKKGACVVDVGMNKINGKWIGDVDFASASKVAGWITPVPGGVGPMTVAMLLENTFTASIRKK